jgi:hypothetical protein
MARGEKDALPCRILHPNLLLLGIVACEFLHCYLNYSLQPVEAYMNLMHVAVAEHSARDIFYMSCIFIDILF